VGMPRSEVPNLGLFCLSEGVRLKLAVEEKKYIYMLSISEYL